jgi:hypothetical protein
VAPTFRELAEQTEKMSELKTTGVVKDFTISQLSLESDGRRIRYSLNLVFDKNKVSVAGRGGNNPSQNNNSTGN